MTQISEELKKRETLFSFGWVGMLSVLTVFCQWVVFDTWKDSGMSLLVGTCGTLFGAFCAVLASPYEAAESERLSKVSSTIATLVTGYALAKIIDPLLTNLISGHLDFSNTKNTANLLMGTISCLSGFLATYQYRAYLSGKFSESPD